MENRFKRRVATKRLASKVNLFLIFYFSCYFFFFFFLFAVFVFFFFVVLSEIECERYNNKQHLPTL